MQINNERQLTGTSALGLAKWWKGMAAEDDMKLASAPGLGMKSPSAEVDAPAMAAMDDRTWQSPNIPLSCSLTGPIREGTRSSLIRCVWPAGPNRSNAIKIQHGAAA